jgi:hypothetical protein
VEFGTPLSSAPSRRYRSTRFRLGLIAAFVALIGTTFALNVRINDNNFIEYGQGIYRIASCDQFVNIALGSSDSSPYGDGLSRVMNIKVQGLDVGRCAGTSIRIRLYDSTNSAPMNLFTNPAYTKSGVSYPCCTETGTAVIMVIASDATQSTALQKTTLISPSGKTLPVGGDRTQSLSYDADSAVFTIAFPVPLAIMRDVAKTTLESASNV